MLCFAYSFNSTSKQICILNLYTLHFMISDCAGVFSINGIDLFDTVGKIRRCTSRKMVATSVKQRMDTVSES